MNLSYKTAWSHDFVTDIDPPELATNDEWRRTMRKARKDHKVDGKSMTQEDLADSVWKVMRQRWPESKHSAEAPSQAALSKVESGDVKKSVYVIAICTVLSIPQPSHYVDDDNRAWAEAGEYMRHKFPEEFARHLEMLEERMRSEKAKEEAAATEDQPPVKR